MVAVSGDSGYYVLVVLGLELEGLRRDGRRRWWWIGGDDAPDGGEGGGESGGDCGAMAVLVGTERGLDD